MARAQKPLSNDFLEKWYQFSFLNIVPVDTVQAGFAFSIPPGRYQPIRSFSKG